MKPFSYELIKQQPASLARVGVIHTPHGDIETPAFVAVGTAATVKALTPEQVAATGAQTVLANTYHLHLRPGESVVEQAGGLHKFMNWPGPTFTDSGGFQVFSLGEAFGKGVSKIASGDESAGRNIRSSQAKQAKVTEAGVTFYSHINGDKLFLDPERSMQIQHALGADIIFAFDECTSPQAEEAYQREAMERTHRWAARSLEEHRKLQPNDAMPRALFGVVQGGRYESLRRESAQALAAMEFDGFGIGGSFNKDDMATAVRWVCEELPAEKPRHLLGIGEPRDLFAGVENGIDTFDCVSPTRIARNGTVYTSQGLTSLSRAEYAADFKPLEATCACYTCQHYSRAYLAHLVRSKEMLAATLLSIHNLQFIVGLVAGMRAALLEGNYDQFKQDFMTSYYV